MHSFKHQPENLSILARKQGELNLDRSDVIQPSNSPWCHDATFPTHFFFSALSVLISIPEAMSTEQLIWITVPGRNQGKTRNKNDHFKYILLTQRWSSNNDYYLCIWVRQETMFHPAGLKNCPSFHDFQRLCTVRNPASWQICSPPECLCSEHTPTQWIEELRGTVGKPLTNEPDGSVQKCSHEPCKWRQMISFLWTSSFLVQKMGFLSSTSGGYCGKE